MKLTILLIATTLSACSLTAQSATKYDAAAAEKVCGVWSQITYSGKLDSPQTKVQIRQNNAARKAFCNQTK